MGPNGEEVKILSVQKSEIEKERAGKNKTMKMGPYIHRQQLKVQVLKCDSIQRIKCTPDASVMLYAVCSAALDGGSGPIMCCISVGKVILCKHHVRAIFHPG
jgi:hypothetical protein